MARKQTPKHPTRFNRDQRMRDWFEGFQGHTLQIAGQPVHWREGGKPDAPVAVLLHGFPQTHVMWQRVAQHLSADYRLVMPDLPGYGDSLYQRDASELLRHPDHSPHSKRAMADTLVALMDQLGVPRFHLCGHDRGGRVAHRMALDHVQRVMSLTVIDIAPTLDMYEGRGLREPYMAFAQAYYHWFHLTQPSPLPESHIGADPRAYLHLKLGGWGSAGLAHLEPQALAEYERCFCRPEAIHSACEDYRASAGIDLQHDRSSRAAGQRVACDMLVLWGARGVVHRLFDPMSLWRAQCSRPVQGHTVDAGHFIPEEQPEATADALRGFWKQT